MSHKDKDKILSRIREALQESSTKNIPSPPNFLSDIYTKPSHQDLSVIFAENLVAVQGNFCFCEDEKDFLINLVSLLKRKKSDQIFVWDKYLQEILDLTDLAYKATDKDFELAEVGITTCEALIARSGSVLVSSRQISGRRLGIYPPVHIIVAFSSQLVPDVQIALENIQKKYPSIPSMVSLITGPSRTADIEKTLVLGAHGPKELHVFLIDDFVVDQ